MEPGELPDQLRSLAPFLEAHHCKSDVVTEAADALEAALLRISELREGLAEALDGTYGIERFKELRRLAVLSPLGG